jgi:hypothetical protein
VRRGVAIGLVALRDGEDFVGHPGYASAAKRAEETLAAIICLLRGVNVGGRGMIKMAELRDLFQDLGFDPVHTVLQSGNVVFGAKSAKRPALAAMIAESIERG